MVKFSLILGKTPLHRLNYRAGDTNIYMKRDDLIPFAFGGNKVRLYEYIAPLAMSLNVNKVITFGSLFSNHLRVTAAVCQRLGIGADLLVLTEDGQEKASINLDLARQFNKVNVAFFKTSEAHDLIDNYLSSQKGGYLWVPGGGHMPEAVFGYIDAAKEMEEQLEEMDIMPEGIFLPTGTGTTQAGLLCGLGKKCQVIGISVARPPERCKDEISSLIDAIRGPSHRGEEKRREEIYVLEGISYGTFSSEVRDIIVQVARTDAVWLDPIYNAPAFLKMVQYLKTHTDLKDVVYLNTGGIPNLFTTLR